ncbi:MAG: diguanylate cyclase [Polyangiaceae bacterium]|nr:diguanylate cyclase [Polyangiaceae bacterium]
MVEPSVQVPGGVVLVVDDDVATRTLVTRLLEQSGFDCREATTGEEALALLRRRGETIDCIVLDVRMPGISGFDVLEAVRADPMVATIPVLLLTAHADTEVDIVRGATLGATDHLSKPFSGAVLRAKVTRAVETCRAQRVLEGRLETAERLARIDPLTQLGNRQLFYERLREEASFAARHKSPLALVVIDIDHFKSLNDSLGHETGDKALVHVAAVLGAALRREDGAFRYGGEEFVVLMRGVDAKAALACTTRLRAALAARPLSLASGASRDITFSAGVAVADATNDFFTDALFARADEALYRAKESGRNRDEVA